MTEGRAERVTPGAHASRSNRHDSRRPGPRRRTAPWLREGRMPVEAIIIDSAALPDYLRIADKTKQLRELGMSDRAIARSLGVSDKTVANSVGPAGALARDVQSQRSPVIERALPACPQRRPVGRGPRQRTTVRRSTCCPKTSSDDSTQPPTDARSPTGWTLRRGRETRMRSRPTSPA